MTRFHARLTASAAVLLLGALALSACADDTATTAPATPIPGASAPISGSGVKDSPAPDADADLSCDGILPADTVKDFTDAGWASRQDPFYVGNIELTGGIQCTWGDPSVASDQVQVFGWAPVTAEQIDEITSELVDSGWKKLDENGVVYITAPEEMIMSRDDDGYGMTYRIRDDDIAVSDTKQGLLLVEWPPAD